MKETALDHVSTAEDIIKRAVHRGCDAAEVYIRSAEGISVEARDGSVEALDASRDFGIAVKIIRKQRLGFSFTTLPERIEGTLDDALAASEWTAEDDYVDIPAEQPPVEVRVFAKELGELREDDVIMSAVSLEGHALSYDRRIKKVRKAEVSLRKGRTTIVNSRGVRTSYDSGYLSASVTPLAEDDTGDSQMGWDFAMCRRPGDLDIAMIGASAAERAIGLLGSRKIEAVRVPVVLDPHVAGQFLSILSSSLSAEAVQKKRSFLADKAGKKVISDLINIVDDGIMQWGIGTRPVDDEGVPTSKKVLVSKGELTGFLHNTYTAGKAGTASTGNASRAGFKSLPGVAVTNIYISPAGDSGGVGGENDLVKGLSKGILITDVMGLHTANPVSGDFSIGISGIWIEAGERKFPVKEAVMTGNILDLFNKVEETGNDLRFYGNIGSPSLLIGEMDISA